MHINFVPLSVLSLRLLTIVSWLQQSDGLHITGPPIKAIVAKFFHHLCRMSWGLHHQKNKGMLAHRCSHHSHWVSWFLLSAKLNSTRVEHIEHNIIVSWTASWMNSLILDTLRMGVSGCHVAYCVTPCYSYLQPTIQPINRKVKAHHPCIMHAIA